MAQVRVLPVLSANGMLGPGTPLEVVPSALPPDVASRDPRVFRAIVAESVTARRSFVWEFDGQSYSPTELTCKLWREHGVVSLAPSYYSHWRVVGRGPSLWEESQALAEAGAA